MKPMDEMTAEEQAFYGKVLYAINNKRFYDGRAQERVHDVQWHYTVLCNELERAGESNVDWGTVAEDAGNLINQLTWLVKEATDADHMGADYRRLRRDHRAEVEDMERELAK